MADEEQPTPAPEPPRVQQPYCICGGAMVLMTTNFSETTQTPQTGINDSLVTVKRNFRCYGCHNTAVFQIDNGDDPLGFAFKP